MSKFTALKTKIQAMSKDMLSQETLNDLVAGEKLNDMINYLKTSPSYSLASKDLSLQAINRRDIELAVQRGVYHDFLKIYKFANFDQRKLLQVYGRRYELEIIKSAIRQVNEQGQHDLEHGEFADYLAQKRHFDIDQLMTARSMTEIVQALSRTDYARIFNLYQAHEETGYQLFILENALDAYVIRKMWQTYKKTLPSQQLQAAKRLISRDVDISNLMSIYRLKFYYHLEEAEISAALIDLGKLQDESIRSQLLFINDSPSFIRLAQSLGYGEIFDQVDDSMALIHNEHRYLRRLQDRVARQWPQSMLAIFNYLDKRAGEADSITQAIEEMMARQKENFRKDSVI
ncbi:hypothetical protein AWM75_02185 [Aerococcus urinaehominis]|uniref:ATPase n=1 Tax=Aerococcus urinaehominis TaxID=128944 RepID=A0A109RGS8_9LACT|nr:V-type ATPase subunit [Aerococcus urinaehominis]AMB98871.1 hypothetical protein AWM75_02185 [Aerococcus urinaehominis]